MFSNILYDLQGEKKNFPYNTSFYIRQNILYFSPRFLALSLSFSLSLSLSLPLQIRTNMSAIIFSRSALAEREVSRNIFHSGPNLLWAALLVSQTCLRVTRDTTADILCYMLAIISHNV